MIGQVRYVPIADIIFRLWERQAGFLVWMQTLSLDRAIPRRATTEPDQGWLLTSPSDLPASCQ